MTRRPMIKRERITPYVTEAVAKTFRLRCASLRLTASAGATAAIEQWVNDTKADDQLVLRRLDQIGRQLDKIFRDGGFHSEAFAVFVRDWLAQVSGNQRAPVAASMADARYERFLKEVVARVSGGPRFVDKLAQEAVAYDPEHDAAVG